MATALFQEPTIPPEVEPADTPEELPEPTAEAPYGWMKDPATGELRPKKTRGRRRADDPEPRRPGVSPSLDDLKADAKGKGSKDKTPAEDVAPQAAQHKHGIFRTTPKDLAAPKAPEPLPPFRAGPIAKGVNVLYRKAGRIVKMWDPQVGWAIIACTQKEPGDDDGVTVGEAWEELARTNPRIRAFLLKMLATGAWSSLFAAHIPIVLAVMLKDGIRERVPFMGLIEAFLVDDDDQGAERPSGLAESLGGVTAGDMAQMLHMAQAMMGDMAAQMPRGMNDVRAEG